MSKKQVLTIPKASTYCGVSRMTMWRWVKSGLLKVSVTPGGHHRIEKKELERFLAKHGMSPLETQSHQPSRILVVDDEPLVQKVLAKTLEAQGYLVDTASDGFEAGIKIMQLQPDLIVLDLVMPGMDGFEVCRFLKADPVTAKIKILVLTGYGTLQEHDKALAAGADLFLAKPVESRIFLDNIDRLLGQKSLVKTNAKKKTGVFSEE